MKLEAWECDFRGGQSGDPPGSCSQSREGRDREDLVCT